MMTVLEAHGVGVVYATAQHAVLKDASFVLDEPGFYGLVGANGAGKTTLLRLFSGDLAPNEGSIRIAPEDALVAYCPQTVDDASDNIRALGSSHEGLAAKLKGRLDLDAGELERWPTLSPGERKRWQIGAALAREPDVLLLDEPTNHIDARARDMLVGVLARFRGVGVIVSHDRDVLEHLPHAILRVHDGHVTMHEGRYSDAKRAWEHVRREREEAHSRAVSTVRAIEHRLDSARRTREATSGSISSRARMKDKNDHDGRSMFAKNLARWADARAGRTVHVVQGELERAHDAVPEIERDRTVGGEVFAKWERAAKPILFHVDAPRIYVGEDEDAAVELLHDVRLTITREDRVRITGDNGAGKTTLLRALVGSNGANNDNKSNSNADSRVLDLPQELSLAMIESHLTALRSLDNASRGRVLSIFGALGSDPERVLGRVHAATLSSGESRKLALAMGLGRCAWALVLDEPTNHLDLPTIERLEHLLAEYPGCIVLVTHDDAFASRVGITRTLRVSEGLVR